MGVCSDLWINILAFDSDICLCCHLVTGWYFYLCNLISLMVRHLFSVLSSAHQSCIETHLMLSRLLIICTSADLRLPLNDNVCVAVWLSECLTNMHCAWRRLTKVSSHIHTLKCHAWCFWFLWVNFINSAPCSVACLFSLLFATTFRSFFAD